MGETMCTVHKKNKTSLEGVEDGYSETIEAKHQHQLSKNKISEGVKNKNSKYLLQNTIIKLTYLCL